MKILLRSEEWAKLAAVYVLSLYTGFAWWVFLALLLAPDISMLGYAINARTGAWVYNLFHHQGVAVIIGLAGLWAGIPALQLTGLILFGHSAMDRALGYGLKYEDAFKHTHLGWIGQDSSGKPSP